MAWRASFVSAALLIRGFLLMLCVDHAGDPVELVGYLDARWLRLELPGQLKKRRHHVKAMH